MCWKEKKKKKEKLEAWQWGLNTHGLPTRLTNAPLLSVWHRSSVSPALPAARSPLSVLFPQCVSPPFLHLHLSPPLSSSRFPEANLSSQPHPTCVCRLRPKPPWWAISFSGGSKHWVTASFLPQFPKHCHCSLVSTQVSGGLGHHVCKQLLPGKTLLVFRHAHIFQLKISFMYTTCL